VQASRAPTRGKFIEWCDRLPAGCVVAMETSSSAHHWARKLVSNGAQLSGSRLGPHLTAPQRSVQQGRLQSGSLFFVRYRFDRTSVHLERKTRNQCIDRFGSPRKGLLLIAAWTP
jgi:hypothetical protein